MKSLTEFKEMSFLKFRVEKKEIPFSDPISFLYSLDWDVPNGPPFSEEEMTKMNLVLDLRSCFGRSVKASVVAETYFPDVTFYSGEVCQDLLRTMLVDGAISSNWNDETYLAEILQYEAPHSVIVYNDKQFDSIFKYLNPNPEALKHPSIIKYDLWRGLHASYLVSEALSIENPNESLRFLLKAESMYPENILIKENIAGKYGILGNLDELIRITKDAVKIRKDAKMLWLLWRLTNEEVYKNQIVSEYNQSMFNYLNKLFL